MRYRSRLIPHVVPLLVALFILVGCPSPTGSGDDQVIDDGTDDTTDPGDDQPGDDSDDPVDPALRVPSGFWGSWVRMDGVDEAWYVSDTEVRIDGVGYAATVVSGSDAEISCAKGNLVRSTENMIQVAPAGGGLSYYLFRRSGATATVDAGVRGAGSSARALSGLMGIEAILKNLTNESNTISSTTDSSGRARYDEVIPGDEYELEIPAQDGVGEAVSVTVRPKYDGESLGFVTVSDASQNFKISYDLSDGDRWGYHYGGGEYEITIRVTNFGGEDMLGAGYEIVPPAAISLSGSSGLHGILNTVRANGGTKELTYAMSVAPFPEDYRDVVIPVTVYAADDPDKVWDDEISIRCYRTTMDIHVRAASSDVQGVVINPEGRSFPFRTTSRVGSITVPALERGYILALSGADYDSETTYALRIGQAPGGDGSAVTDPRVFEPNNDETQGTDVFVGTDYLGYLYVSDLDFFNVHNAIGADQAVSWAGITPADGATVDDTTPELRWDAVYGTDRYEVQIAEGAAPTDATPTLSTASTYLELEPLTNNVTHWWRIRAVDAAGTATDWSDPFELNVSWGVVDGLLPASGATTSDTRPELSWNVVDGAAGYQLQIAGSVAALDDSVTHETTEPRFTPAQPLANEATHHWRVRAVDGDGQATTWSAVNSITISWAEVTGLAPADGTLTDDTTPDLTWTAIGDAASYEARIAESVAALEDASAVSTEFASYTPPALDNLQTHVWQVRAIDGDGQATAWTTPRTVHVRWGDVSGLSPISGATVGMLAPMLSWTALSDAAGYDVEIEPKATGLDGAGARRVSEASSYTPDSALTNATTYEWRVRAVDDDGQNGAWSDTREVSIAWGTVLGMSPSMGAVVADTTPELTWSAIADASSYEVQIAATAGALETATTHTTTTNTYTPAALANNSTHARRVRAVDGDGQYGAWSSAVTFTIDWGDLSGTAPTSGTTTSDTTPTLAWTALSDAAGYELRIAPSGTDVDTVSAIELTDATYTPATGTPLTNDETYTWRVRAIDAAGQGGAWTSPSTLTIAWGAVSGLSPAGGATVADTTPELTWSAIADASSYEVQIAATAGALETATTHTTTTNTYTPAALANNSTHAWRVRAVDGDGQYGAWSTATFAVDVDAGVTIIPDLGNPFDLTISGALGIVERAQHVTVTAEASVPVDAYVWYLDDTRLSGSASAVTIGPDLSPGNHVVTIVAFGGASAASAEWRFEVFDTVPVPRDGLVAEFLFEGSAADTSGSGNDGVVYGAALVEDRFGTSDSALRFDGSNDYVRVANSDSLNLRSSITIAVWINPTYLDEVWKGIVTKCPASTTWNGYGLRLAGRWPAASIELSSTSTDDWAASTTALTGEWLFAAYTYTDSTGDLVVYVDGVAEREVSVSGTIADSSAWPLVIGWDMADLGGRHFSGLIDDVRVYNRALSEAEIGTLFQEGGWDGE